MPDSILQTDVDLTVLSQVSLTEQYAQDLVLGLANPEVPIPIAYYYNDAGSRIFEQLCQEPDYYIARTEKEIIAQSAASIASAAGDVDLVDLGCGNAHKTISLLSAFTRAYGFAAFNLVDVNQYIVEKACATISEQVDAVHISALIGTFEDCVPALPRTRTDRMYLVLGSTLAQFTDEALARFLAFLRDNSRRGDKLLVSFDLYKDPRLLVAAYDTPVLHAYQMNGLDAINEVFEGDIATDAIKTVTVWNAPENRIEIRLRFLEDQEVTLKALDFAHRFEAGSETLAHIMRKMPPPQIVDLLEREGLTYRQVWTDPREFSGIFLFEF